MTAMPSTSKSGTKPEPRPYGDPALRAARIRVQNLNKQRAAKKAPWVDRVLDRLGLEEGKTKITKRQLARIIKEELENAMASRLSEEELDENWLKKLIGREEEPWPPRAPAKSHMWKDPETGENRWVTKDEYEDLATIEEGKCPPGQYWKSFGGQGGTCVKDPDYKPKSAYSQGGTVSPPRGSWSPKYEE